MIRSRGGCALGQQREGKPRESATPQEQGGAAREVSAAGRRGITAEEVTACLPTARLGRPMLYLREVDSTNREAERWAGGGAPEGALVIAEHQRAGRGRLGRSWLDLPGQSLLLSLVLRPPVSPAWCPALTFVAAVALADALDRWIPRDLLEIKWPNDVLCGGRKVAGILLEMRCEGERVEHVILGVGVNVGGNLARFPQELRRRCTSVAEWAKDSAPDRLDVLCAFLGELERWYAEFLSGGLQAIRERWNSWFKMAGQRLRAETDRGVVEGAARGLGPTGALVLETDDGRFLEILAGDVERSTVNES